MSQTQQPDPTHNAAGGPWTDDVLHVLRALLAGDSNDDSNDDSDTDSNDDSASDEAPAAGAALHVTDAAGAPVYSASLARMCRLDGDDAAVLWVRPIAGRTDDDPAGTPMFSLSEARRRTLAATVVELRHDPDTGAPVITADLRTGQRAIITAAAGAELLELIAWDTFTLTVLSAADEAALETLTEDSWHGPHA